jgi:dolichyl-phosphate-mannose-protein mannosyltransferase
MTVTLVRERSLGSAWQRAIGSAWVARALVGGLLALGLGLRLWGLDWGLPWAFHPDEINYVDHAQDIITSGSLNPNYFENPSLLTYLVALELVVARALGPLAGPLRFDLPASAYLLARLDSALLGTASLALVLAIGRALFGRVVGLVAALLLAVAFLHVRDSHYGVNDVPSTALLLLSVWYSLRLWRQPRLRWYLLAGLAGGLATSTKYNMGFFFVPLLVAHLLGGRRLSRGGLLGLAAAALAGLAGYLLGTPYTLLDFAKFRTDFLTQLGYGNNRWLGQGDEPVPLLYLTSLLQGFGALALALALAALIWGLLVPERRAGVLLVAAFPLAYLAFMLPKALFFPRFALPLLPFLALLAALALVELASRLPAPALGRAALGTALLLATAGQSLGNDLRHNWLLGQTDSRIQANQWVQANLPPGSRLKVESYSLLDRSAENRTYTPNLAGLKIELFLSAPADDQYGQFLDKDVQYFVTSSFAFERFLGDAPVRQDSARRFQRFHRELEQRAQLVATFGPGPGGGEVPYREEDKMTPFWGLEQYVRPGPTLRVYALTRSTQRGG